MITRLKLRLLIVCSAALAAAFLPVQLVTAKEVKAIAPKIHGWWTQTYIEGIGSVQPDVPEKGMLVENGPNGPTAFSALRFSLKDRAIAQRLRLSISGTPVITQPPVACITTTRFESAQGGAWEEGPGYKCKHSVPGVVNAEQTEIRFAVGKLAKNRSLSVVILAGGPTDRIAFDKPGPETLSLSIKTNSTAPPPPAAPLDEAPEPSTASQEPDACCATGEVDAPPLRDRREAPVVEPGLADAVPPPAAQPAAAPAALDDAGRQETRRVLGTTLGLTLLLLSILYWSDGFGALGLRSFLVARIHEGSPRTVKPEDRQAAGGVSGQPNLPPVPGTS